MSTRGRTIADMSPEAACVKLVALSTDLDQLMQRHSGSDEAAKLSQITLRAIDEEKDTFIPKQATSWGRRFVDRLGVVFSKNRAMPYDLEANLGHLVTLMGKAAEWRRQSSEAHPCLDAATAQQLKMRFRGEISHAIELLVRRICLLVANHESAQALRAKVELLHPLFQSSFGAAYEIRKKLAAAKVSLNEQDYLTVQELLRNKGALLRKQECYAFVVECAKNQLACMVHEKNRSSSSSSSSSKPTADIVLGNLFAEFEKKSAAIAHCVTAYGKEWAVELADQRALQDVAMSMLYELIGERLKTIMQAFQIDATGKMKEAKTLKEFYQGQEALKGTFRRLIELDKNTTDSTLCRVFCRAMKAFGKACETVELSRYTALITHEVLPEIRKYMRQIETEKKDDLQLLLEVFNSYLQFLRKVALQITCPKNASSCPESDLLQQAIALVELGKETIEKRLKALPQSHEAAVQQTITKEGTKIVVTNSKDGECAGSRVMSGIMPIGMEHLVQYGVGALLYAAASYYTAGIPLTWSLVSGIAFSVAPDAAKAVSKKVLPKSIATTMEPIVDFAVRLVVWRYGTDVVQMVADVQETAPIEMAQAASMAASATASKVFNMGHRVSKLPIGPVAETAVDVYKKNAGKEERPQDMPVKEIKKAIVVSPDTRDTTGIVGRSMAYLATIFMLTAKKRAVSI